MKRRSPRRFRDAVGQSEYLHVRTALWFPSLVFLTCLGATAAAWLLTEPIAYFGKAFVEILQVTKVLKLPVLEDPIVYRYLSWALYGYVSFAFLFDTAKWASSGFGQDLLLTQENVVFIRRRILGYDIVRWKKSDPVRVELRSGRIRRILALERLVFHFPDRTIATPWFSSWRGDNALIVSRLL